MSRTDWRKALTLDSATIKTCADAARIMRQLAEAYARVDVTMLTAGDYRLLFPIESGIRRGMHTAPNFAFDISGSHWDGAVWADPAFLAANEVLSAAEYNLKARLTAFAVSTTRAFLDDPTWLDMMHVEAMRRNISEAALERLLAKARRDATTGLDGGWVWIEPDNLLDFYAQLDDWRARTGKTNLATKESAHAAA